MYFDRFDILSAWYLWLTWHHEGLHSRAYKRLCLLRKRYRPPQGMDGLDKLNKNARAIYENIKKKRGR